MSNNSSFNLKDFMPYLLNQAADATSRDFQSIYKTKYGMLRTEWRVVFHLGHYGQMTAKEICDRARIHKTKVSRAVHSLEAKKFLSRKPLVDDRRHEMLSLTATGKRVFEDLFEEAQNYDANLMAEFSDAEVTQMREFLVRIAKL